MDRAVATPRSRPLRADHLETYMGRSQGTVGWGSMRVKAHNPLFYLEFTADGNMGAISIGYTLDGRSQSQY
jgi:hypothetical protein